MAGFRAIKKEIYEQHQVPNTSIAKRHYNDLIYSAMMLCNKIAKGIKNRNNGRGFVDTVLKASNVIEKATLMRHIIKGDEDFHKTHFIDFYRGVEMECRVPYQVDDFKTFCRRDIKVKTLAIDIVTKMHGLDQINRMEVALERAAVEGGVLLHKDL